MNPKNEIECAAGVLCATLTWVIGHYNLIVGGLVGTTALAVWLLKLRREWKHRDDPPQD